MVTNKFGKISGPGAQATPADNSVTSTKILNGEVATADLAATSVTAAKLGSDVAGDGISGGNGAAIDLDLHDLTAEVISVAADKIAFMDATDNSTKLEAVSDMIGLVAGTASSTALTASSGVLTVAPTEVVTDVAADSLIIRDATDSKVHRDTISDVVTLVAGTVAATGLTASGGVLTVAPTDTAVAVAADSFVFSDATDGATRKDLISDVATAMADGTTISASGGQFSVKTSSIGIAQMANDDKASIFYITGEIDFGSHAAVTQDLGAIGSKATLIGGYWTLTESMANGDASETVTLGTATGGGSPIAADLTITQANTTDGLSNFPGMMRAILPNGGTSVDMADTTHLWLDVDVDAAARDAGKVKVFLILQKSS